MPGGAKRVGAGSRSRPWITERCLDAAADGATVTIALDARVTPLAQEIADRRGIRLRRGPSSAAGFGGDHAPIVAIGSDHGGFALKQHLMATIQEWGYRVLDQGTRDERACDYPDFALAVAECVAEGRALFGVCIDGAGIGSAMTAGKVPGVLPANCWDERTAANAREHNHANVLCLGAGHLDRLSADAVLKTFLFTPTGPGRHARRVDKIWAVEARYARTTGDAPQGR
ncbi:MAG: RpiB/LacA/LacB family sugar-phosphate isomerase [Planctomycetes bacterium]|nr:RpiB/LacA/LacB family sugar-phosphate isomerase [Planctomycetota bacterium]